MEISKLSKDASHCADSDKKNFGGTIHSKVAGGIFV